MYNDTDQELARKEQAICDLFIREFATRQSKGELRRDLKAEWMFSMMYNVLFMLWKEIHEGSIAAKDAPRILMSTLLDGFMPKNQC